MQDEQNLNILIVKNRAMGDAIMGLGALAYLRELYPNANIIYGVPAWVAPIFSKTKHIADEILPIKLNTFKDFIHLWKTLKNKKINLIFEMHQSGRTAKIFTLYKHLCFKKCNYFFHNHHLKSGTQVLDQGVIKSVIQRDLDGIYSYLSNKLDLVPSYLDYTPKLQTNISNESSLPKIIIGVVATRATKMWDLNNYIDLMKKIKDQYEKDYGETLNFIIPLSRSRTDQEIKSELLKNPCSSIFEIKEVPLEDLPELINGARLYIGNDTGLKHLAISLGVKSYTFFGPEPPNEWHPYNTNIHKYFYKDGLECRTKDLHYCGLSTCETMICQKELTVEDAFAKIKKDLN